MKLTHTGPDEVKGTVAWSAAHKAQCGSPTLAGGLLISNELVGIGPATGEVRREADKRCRFRGGYGTASVGGRTLIKFTSVYGGTTDVTTGRSLSDQLRLHESDGGKRSPLKARYEEEMRRRADRAVAEGVLRYRDRSFSHGSWADIHGSTALLHGSRI